MRMLSLLRAYAADRMDWERPGRKGARLRPDMRCYTKQIRTWPLVYRIAPGTFHIQAPHRVPHADTLSLIGWACLAAAASAVWWCYSHVGIPAAIGSAALLSPLLLLYSLGERRLEIVIRPDGWIGRRRLDGKLEGWVNIRDEPDYQIHVQAHSEAGATAALNATIDAINQQITAHKPHPEAHGLPSFGPSRNVHDGATELWIGRGPGGADWIRVAEFAPGRGAVVLAATLHFLIEQVDAELLPLELEPSDR